MMSQYHFKEVRKLKKQGFNKSQIAKKLGLDWKTVSKYWESNSPPQSQPRVHRTRKDPVASFEPRLNQLLETIKEIKPIDIFERLRKEGYQGSERTIQRRVGKIQGQKPKDRIFEQEYTPGEQSQFDFKESVELPFIDGSRSVNLHYGTLPFSGKTGVRGYPFLNYECFLDGIHNFFESIGGMTEKIRIDNLAVCVKQVLKGRKRLWADRFSKSMEYYGFEVLPCTPGEGKDKGDVERDIQTYTRRIKIRVELDSIVFKDWDHLNEWLKKFMEEEQNDPERVEKLNQEKQTLQALPQRNLNILCKVEVVSSSSHGTVKHSKSLYSVPDSAIESKCTMVLGPYQVQVYKTSDPKQPIATHARVPDGKHSLLLAHILPSLLRKPQAMVRWAHREILFPVPIFKNYYDYLVKRDSYSAEREFLRSINLVHHVDLKEIATGIELILGSKSTKPFDDLKELLLLERRPCSVINISELLEQQPIQPELSEYDSFIPKTKEGTNENETRRTG